MTILFKSKHVPMLLSNPPSKTQTRRSWKRPKVRVSRTYWLSTTMITRDGRFGKALVKRGWWEMLGEISTSDAVDEGYGSQAAYIAAFAEISKKKEEAVAIEKVYCLDLEMVAVVAGKKWCGSCGRQYAKAAEVSSCDGCGRAFFAVDTSHLKEVEV